MRELWQNEINFCPNSYTIWKVDTSTEWSNNPLNNERWTISCWKQTSQSNELHFLLLKITNLVKIAAKSASNIIFNTAIPTTDENYVPPTNNNRKKPDKAKGSTIQLIEIKTREQWMLKCNATYLIN